MESIARRTWLTGTSTISRFSIDELSGLYILEDRVRPNGEKVYGETAIPEGRFRVKLLPSPHFGRVMPYLQGVPNFTAIMIHNGIKPADTDGCQLAGLHRDGEDRIRDSVAALEIVLTLFTLADKRGEEIWHTVTKDESLFPTSMQPLPVNP